NSEGLQLPPSFLLSQSLFLLFFFSLNRRRSVRSDQGCRSSPSDSAPGGATSGIPSRASPSSPLSTFPVSPSLPSPFPARPRPSPAPVSTGRRPPRPTCLRSICRTEEGGGQGGGGGGRPRPPDQRRAEPRTRGEGRYLVPRRAEQRQVPSEVPPA
ncbi:unnamed protein product, partial [Musa textilis]